MSTNEPQTIRYQEVCSDSDWCVVKIIPEPLTENFLKSETERGTLYEFGVSLAPEGEETESVPIRRAKRSQSGTVLREHSERKNSKIRRRQDSDNIKVRMKTPMKAPAKKPPGGGRPR